MLLALGPVLGKLEAILLSGETPGPRTMKFLFVSPFILTFVCTTSLAATPSLTGVYNAAGWVPPGLPNSGVAQGAIFTVTATGLGPAALRQVQSYPLPTTQGFAGITIKVTVGGVQTCIMVYTLATRAAAILPLGTAVGTGTLTLSYQGGSAILSLLPPNGFGTTTNAGVDIQVSGIPLSPFTVAGSPGLDAGFFSAFVTNGAVATLK